MALTTEDLLERLVKQNEQLIEVLSGALSGALSALQPPPQYTAPPPDPWRHDEERRGVTEDPWADPQVPSEAIIPGYAGWVNPPFAEKPPEEVKDDEVSGAE